MRRLIVGVGAFIIVQMTCSCSDDSGVIRNEYRPQASYASDTHEMPSNSTLGVFLVASDGTILYFAKMSAREPFLSALSKETMATLDSGGVIEIYEQRAIEGIMEAIRANGSGITASAVFLVGILNFEECLWECCGGPSCDWGLIKYCFMKCSQDHEPKPEQP